MKSIVFYSIILLLLFVSSCCDEDISQDQILFDCSYERLGSTTANSSGPVIMSYGTSNIIFPDGDSLDQLVLFISIIDTLQESVPYTIESLSCKVNDLNGKLVFEGNKSPIVDDGNCAMVHHLWDGFTNGEPYYGEFFLNMEINLDNDRYIIYDNANIISVSCEDFELCFQFPERCNIVDCRYGHTISLSQCGWGHESFSVCE